MTVLDEIVRVRRLRLAAEKSAVPLSELKSLVGDMPAALDFEKAVKRNEPDGRNVGLRLIAELKKASPSRGLIRADFDPGAIASIYRERASAISVLTERDFFQGANEFIGTVKKAAPGKPVLRKDFLFDQYQLYESRALGADAVLLIARLLERGQAGELLHLGRELGMGVLFEVHDFEDLEKALRVNAAVIGVNNRDLATLKTDLGRTLEIKREIPDKTVVSESGIETRADMCRLASAGVDAVLVGTAFMRASDIRAKIEELMGGSDQNGQSQDMRD